MTLELDVNEVNFILEVLTNAPYRQVAPLIQKIAQQLPPPAPAAE
ncbi:MAG: hypothetical protein RL441_1484 [Actinomycetota bacterium]